MARWWQGVRAGRGVKGMGWSWASSWISSGGRLGGMRFLHKLGGSELGREQKGIIAMCHFEGYRLVRENQDLVVCG